LEKATGFLFEDSLHTFIKSTRSGRVGELLGPIVGRLEGGFVGGLEGGFVGRLEGGFVGPAEGSRAWQLDGWTGGL